MMMTFTQTAGKHGLNAMAYLHYVLERFAQYEGEPRNLCELFPWNIPEETRLEYGMTYQGGDSP